MINSISTYPVQYPINQDTQHTQQPTARPKRSLDQQDYQVSAFDAVLNTDKSRRRNSGGLDSLGQGRVL